MSIHFTLTNKVGYSIKPNSNIYPRKHKYIPITNLAIYFPTNKILLNKNYISEYINYVKSSRYKRRPLLLKLSSDDE